MMYIMGKLKIAEIVVLAGVAILSAAKYVIKVIDYFFKLKCKNVASAT